MEIESTGTYRNNFSFIITSMINQFISILGFLWSSKGIFICYHWNHNEGLLSLALAFASVGTFFVKETVVEINTVLFNYFI